VIAEIPKAKRSKPQLDNAAIAELLGREAEGATGHTQLALTRAGRKAFLWEVEAMDLVRAGKSLTDPEGVGPFIARRIHEWIDKPPKIEKPPEIRREFLTMAQARRVLDEAPRFRSLLKGDLQMHTVWSDGSGTLLEMAEAAKLRGYHFISITDHTQGLKIANGLDERRLERQGREIKDLNSELPDFTVLKSAEVNLSPLGEADMDTSALDKLDIVLGCFHSALRRTEDQTDRYLAAIRNPNIHILGHPQTRVYNHRVGLKADWHRLFAEAARLDKAIEIDGYADRQDLKLSLVKIAKQEGTRISLGTDAHHPWQLAFIDFSLASACLAKIPPDRILNFMTVNEVMAWADAIREKASSRTRRSSRTSSK
jgi:histidinol phosphatase-like PHP family hydrolase